MYIHVWRVQTLKSHPLHYSKFALFASRRLLARDTAIPQTRHRTHGTGYCRWTYRRVGFDPPRIESGMLYKVYFQQQHKTKYIIIKHNTIQHNLHTIWTYTRCKSNLCWKGSEQKCNTYLWFTPHSDSVCLLWGVVAQWLESRFETWTSSFTPHCLCLSDETLYNLYSAHYIGLII